MQIRLVAVLLLSFLVASRADAQFRVEQPAPGEQFHVELGLMFWNPTPGIQIQTGSLAALGESEVDFVQEFGIEKERFKEFRAVLKAAKKHKIRITHVTAEYNAATTLGRTIVRDPQRDAPLAGVAKGAIELMLGGGLPIRAT